MLKTTNFHNEWEFMSPFCDSRAVARFLTC